MPWLAITRLTAANYLRQPVLWLGTGIALALLALCLVFGMFNFLNQDRMRLLITAGVAIHTLLGLFLAVIGASQAVHDELASRTALTLFAKPINRHDFLIGKTLGIFTALIPPAVVIASAHLLVIGMVNDYGFDFFTSGGSHAGHDHGEGIVEWIPWGRIAGAHALAVIHAGILTSLAASLALRLGLIANIIACFALFVAAHLLAGIGHATNMAALVPSLPLFAIDEALQFPDATIEPSYFLLCLLYALLYAGGAMCIGLALFKRQDIP
ncbi:MAG: ABC transporter permease [Planctomycetota bacterium]|jgi:ABC-type transport system involved in multi-copper enzyme maturation permease subunit